MQVRGLGETSRRAKLRPPVSAIKTGKTVGGSGKCVGRILWYIVINIVTLQDEWEYRVNHCRAYLAEEIGRASGMITREMLLQNSSGKASVGCLGVLVMQGLIS
jgi:hypothetical protein